MIVKLQPTEDGALLHLDADTLQKLGVTNDAEVEVSAPLSANGADESGARGREATAEEVEAALGRVNSAYGGALRRLGQ